MKIEFFGIYTYANTALKASFFGRTWTNQNQAKYLSLYKRLSSQSSSFTFNISALTHAYIGVTWDQTHKQFN